MPVPRSQSTQSRRVVLAVCSIVVLVALDADAGPILDADIARVKDADGYQDKHDVTECFQCFTHDRPLNMYGIYLRCPKEMSNRCGDALMNVSRVAEPLMDVTRPIAARSRKA